MMNKQEKYSDPVWIEGMEYITLPFYTMTLCTVLVSKIEKVKI